MPERSFLTPQEATFILDPSLDIDAVNANGLPCDSDICQIDLRFGTDNKGVQRPIADHCPFYKLGDTNRARILACAGCIIGTTRRTENEQLAEQLEKDQRTGLYNSNALPGNFSRLLAQGRRANGDKSALILYVDLDGFKSVNDTFGHRKGDETLKRVATELTQMLRKTDYAHRVGGDEFVLMLGSVKPDSIDELVKEIREKLTFNAGNDAQKVPISASIGVREIKATEIKKITESHSAESMIMGICEEADILMIADKEKRGGGR